MNSRIEIRSPKRTTARCKLCHGALRPGIECVVLADIPVSPRIEDLFFHYGCFFDAVAKAEKGVEKTAEYRSRENVPAKRLWMVGTRKFESRRHK